MLVCLPRCMPVCVSTWLMCRQLCVQRVFPCYAVWMWSAWLIVKCVWIIYLFMVDSEGKKSQNCSPCSFRRAQCSPYFLQGAVLKKEWKTALFLQIGAIPQVLAIGHLACLGTTLKKESCFGPFWGENGPLFKLLPKQCFMGSWVTDQNWLS